MSTSNLCVRVDSELKQAVESCLADMGLNLSTAITIYLKRIARDHEIPFKISAAPRINQETLDAIEEGIRKPWMPSRKAIASRMTPAYRVTMTSKACSRLLIHEIRSQIHRSIQA